MATGLDKRFYLPIIGLTQLSGPVLRPYQKDGVLEAIQFGNTSYRRWDGTELTVLREFKNRVYSVRLHRPMLVKRSIPGSSSQEVNMTVKVRLETPLTGKKLRAAIRRIYSVGKSTEDNFFVSSVADWTLITDPNFRFIANHISNSGSAYMYTKEGVYRKSDHWNYGIASCVWPIEGRFYDSGTDIVGFCKWKDFRRFSYWRSFEAQQAVADHLFNKTDIATCNAILKKDAAAVIEHLAKRLLEDAHYMAEGVKPSPGAWVERIGTNVPDSNAKVNLNNQIGYFRSQIDQIPPLKKDPRIKRANAILRGLKKQFLVLEQTKLRAQRIKELV